MWKACCLPNHIPLGSKWRERKPHDYRVVEVVGFDRKTGKVEISYCGRVTKAKISRFGADYKRELDC